MSEAPSHPTREPAIEPGTVSPGDPKNWTLRQPFRAWHVLLLLFVFLVLGWSAHRNELDRAAATTAQGIAYAVGVADQSEMAKGWTSFFGRAFPMVFAERTDIQRIESFDPLNLPPLAYVTREATKRWDVLADDWVDGESVEYLVVPYGYLLRVGQLMLQTVEIGIWGTLIALVVAVPLGMCGASNFTPHPLIYAAARGVCSFSRSMPELLIAMFFVLLYGFGPVAGTLALVIHSYGFLGKFFADDIENADPGPQEALRCTGANRLQVLRFAVLPQVAPQFLAYAQYILERNVRSATVLGIVGAGGIGMELKGRWDLSDFGHVSTILLTIFLTVLALEHLTQRLRRRLI